jgi:probable F420-dependent oxidoreductase
MSELQYGVYLPNYGVFGDACAMADLACEAEAAGWDGFFVWDHIAHPTEHEPGSVRMVDPWVGLAAVALVTSTLRIGTTVTPVPRRRPAKLARETVSLDHLSGGRLILGVGIGLGEAEWHDLGEEPDQRVRGPMLDEGLDVLAGLWSGEPFSYTGQHYRVQNAHFLPTPVQEPRIPVWVGGFWPNKAPFRRMARWDGMFPLFEVHGPEQIALLRESIDFVREERARLGRTGPFDIVNVGVTPGDDAAEAAVRVGAAADCGITWWLELLMPEVYGFAAGDGAGFVVLRERVSQGPPRV